jgi:hypothetical protein
MPNPGPATRLTGAFSQSCATAASSRAVVAVGAFFRWSRTGVALRALADDPGVQRVYHRRNRHRSRAC